MQRELASLAPWAWDPLVGKHAPGSAMMRDFTEVAADKVVTGNTYAYDFHRFAVNEGWSDEVSEGSLGTTKHNDDTRSPGFMFKSDTTKKSPRLKSKPVVVVDEEVVAAKTAVAKRARSPTGAGGGGTPAIAIAPTTAAKATPKLVGKGNGKAATPTTIVSAGKKASTLSGKALAGPSKGKTKTVSNLNSAAAKARSERVKAQAVVGKNLVDALDLAAAVRVPNAVVRVPAPSASVEALAEKKETPGKENAPNLRGANGVVVATGARSARGDRRQSDAGGGLGDSYLTKNALSDRGEVVVRALKQLPPLLPKETRNQRERALLAVAAAEASNAEALSKELLHREAPHLTNAQALLQAYYSLTGSRVLPVVGNFHAAVNAESLGTRPDSDSGGGRLGLGSGSGLGSGLGVQTTDPQPNQTNASQMRWANSFHTVSPVCVTVGPFRGHGAPAGHDAPRFFSQRDDAPRIPHLATPLAKACDYLGKRDLEEAAV